jgi:hypothetical protein
MNDDETGVYDKFKYVLGSVGGELQTLESISMQDIINPNTTGTITIKFNQALGEENLNAYVSLNPAYIGTIGDITSENGGLTYTGTVTLNEGINRINNKVNLNYNGVTGEASYDVVESDGVTITNEVLEKEYKEDSKRYATKISPDGSHIGVIDLKAMYDTLSTIIYEYDSATNDYVQKGSVLKTGSKIEFSNDGNYVLIGKEKFIQYIHQDNKVYHYKYNSNTLDWDLVNEIVGYHYDDKSYLKDISMDGSGKRILVTRERNMSLYDYDEINDTLIETNLGGFNLMDGKISNDGNVLYSIDYWARIRILNYNGTNWTDVYYETIVNSPGLDDLVELRNTKVSMSNDGKIFAVTSSLAYKIGYIPTKVIFIMEYDTIKNEFSLKGDIMYYDEVGEAPNSIDITGDGNRIAVGDTKWAGHFFYLEGNVEVYDYNSVTNNWDLYTRILGGGGEKDNFGDHLSITNDGTKITVSNTNIKYVNRIASYYIIDPRIEEYSRVYRLERGIERKLLTMSLSDTTIKFPEGGATFEVKFSTNEKTIEEIQGNVRIEPIGAGEITNVSLSNSGYSLVGTYNAPTQTESTGNKLKYVEGGLSAEVEFILSTSVKAISNICFYGEARVLTSEGYKEIREVKKGMKVQGEEIEEVTMTKTEEKEIVLMRKGALMKNMPINDTRITKEHKVLYKGEMLEAKKLVNGENIVYEKYNGEALYNILLSGEGKMVVNGMIVETLSPSNNIAKLYKMLKGYSEKEKEEIVKIYNEERMKKKVKSKK